MKPIRLSKHALGYVERRGFTVNEVIEAVKAGNWKPVGAGKRMECRKNFLFNASWNGKYYATKQIRPIVVEEDREIVVITVYTYYF